MRPIRYCIVLISLLCLALLTLGALAHASPLDETWQPGIYDDADFDDVIALITLLSGAEPDSLPDSLHRAPVVRGIIFAAGPGDLPTRLHLPDASRSPPSF